MANYTEKEFNSLTPEMQQEEVARAQKEAEEKKNASMNRVGLLAGVPLIAGALFGGGGAEVAVKNIKEQGKRDYDMLLATMKKKDSSVGKDFNYVGRDGKMHQVINGVDRPVGEVPDEYGVSFEPGINPDTNKPEIFSRSFQKKAFVRPNERLPGISTDPTGVKPIEKKEAGMDRPQKVITTDASGDKVVTWLKPGQSANLGKSYEAETKEKEDVKKLQKDTEKLDSLLNTYKSNLKPLLDKGVDLAGFSGAAKKSFPLLRNKEENEVYRNAMDIASQIIYMRSGAQINEQEYKRLSAPLGISGTIESGPSLNVTKPGELKRGFEQMMVEMENIRNSRVKSYSPAVRSRSEIKESKSGLTAQEKQRLEELRKKYRR